MHTRAAWPRTWNLNIFRTFVLPLRLVGRFLTNDSPTNDDEVSFVCIKKQRGWSRKLSNVCDVIVGAHKIMNCRPLQCQGETLQPPCQHSNPIHQMPIVLCVSLFYYYQYTHEKEPIWSACTFCNLKVRCILTERIESRCKKLICHLFFATFNWIYIYG